MTGGRLPCWWYDVLFPGHQRTVKTSTRIAETTGAGSTGAGLEVTAFVGSLSPGDGISVKRDACVIASLPGVCQLGVGFLHEIKTKGVMSGFFPQLCVLEHVRVFTRGVEETQDLGTDEPKRQQKRPPCGRRPAVPVAVQSTRLHGVEEMPLLPSFTFEVYSVTACFLKTEDNFSL